VPARESHSIFSGEKLSESENDGASPSAEEDCCSVLKVLISELKAEMHFRGEGRDTPPRRERDMPDKGHNFTGHEAA
jgi:hypothetical protein